MNEFLKMLLVGQKLEILSIALKVKLFKVLQKEALEVEAIAKEIALPLKSTKLLLDALRFLSLIEEQKDVYLNTKLSEEYFIYGSSSYCGDMFLNRKELLNHSRKILFDAFKGKEFNFMNKNIEKKWASSSKELMKQEQKNFIAKEALKIVKQLKDFPQMKKMLDLGCSSGLVGLELAKNNENLEGRLFDFAEVAEVTQEHIEEYNLGNRVKTIAGNMLEDDIGSGYDLIWCSNIFYFSEEKEKLIKKIYEALNPNGVLISAHVEIDENDKAYEDSFFYFLHFNLHNRTVLKPMQLSTAFEEIGFRSINSYTNYDFPMTATQIHIARK